MNEAVFRNGEPVHVDSSGYFLTPSAEALRHLGGRLKDRRDPDGAIEILISRAGFLTTMVVSVSMAALFFVVIWAIGQAGPNKAQFWMTVAASVIGGGIFLLGFFGYVFSPLTTNGFNPLVRWDPNEQVLSFDAGRVKLAKDDIRAMSLERRGVSRYHNGEGRTWFTALWIKVDEGEYITLPLPLLSGANQRVVREFVKSLPIPVSVK